MTKRLFIAGFAVCCLAPLGVSAQTVTSSLKGLHDITRASIMDTAELLGEDLYSYRPTDEVRSAGQILAHVANAQYMICSVAAGEDSPATENFEESRTTKAQIIEALEMGFTYCDGVYDEMSDERGSAGVTFFGSPNTAHGVLAFNSAHNYEHYGNLVTYMRINGITPPSSR